MDFENFTQLNEIENVYLYTLNKCEEKTFKGHDESVFSMTLNNTGSLLYTGSEDKTIRVWNTKTCNEIKNLRMKGQGVTALINNDNYSDFLFSGEQSGLIKQWNTQNGQEIIENRMEGHQGPINSLTMNKDGSKIYSASRDRTIRVWDTESSSEIQNLRIETDHDVMTITFNYVNNVFYTGSAYENFIRIWDIETNQEFQDLKFKGHTDEIITIIFVPEMKKLFSCSEDQTVRVWDPITRLELKELRISQIEFDITSMDINKDGSKMYLGSADGKVVLWENQISSKPEMILKNDRKILQISGDQFYSKYAVATFENGDIYLWDTEIKKKKFYSNGNTDKILYISEIILNSFFTIYEDGMVRIFTIKEDTLSQSENDDYNEAMQQIPEIVEPLEPTFEFQIQKFKDIDFGFIYNTNQIDYEIFIVQGDGILKHYSIKGQVARLIRKMEGHKDQITCAVFNPHLKRFYTGSLDETIRVWDLNTYEELEDLIIEGHGYQINDMVINSGSTRIYSCSEQEKIIRVWDATTCESLDQLTFKGHTKPVLQIELSDKNRLYSSSFDQTIRVWDTKTGNEIKEYRITSLEGIYENLLITRNSNYEEKLIATNDRKILLWNLESFSDISNVRYQMNVVNLLKKNHPRLNNHLKTAQNLIQYIKNSFPFLKINTKIGLLLSQLSQGEIIIDYLEALGYNHYNYDLIEEILRMIFQLQKSVSIIKRQQKGSQINFLPFQDTGNLQQLSPKSQSPKNRSPKNSQIQPIRDYEEGNYSKSNFGIQFFAQDEEELLENLEYNLEEILYFLYENYDEETYISTQAIKSLVMYGKLQNLVSNVVSMYYQKKLNVVRIQKLPTLISKTVRLKSDLDIRSNDYQRIQKRVPKLLESNKIVQYEVYHSKFGLEIKNGSYFSIIFFRMLSQSDFENQSKFKNLIDYKFSRLYKYILVWSFLYFIFAILYNVAIYVYPHNKSLFAILKTLVILLLLLEFKTAMFSLKIYLSDFYNILDIFLLIFALVTLFLSDDLSTKQILEFITIVLVNFRATLELRVFSEMRYLIAMILQVFKKIIPFLILMTIFIYMYASMLMSADIINKSQVRQSYWDKMQVALNLGLGDFDSDEQKEWNLFNWFIFLFNAITLTVMMLNLIISIISDIFAQFSQDQKIVDIQQKVELILNADMLLFIPQKVLYYLPQGGEKDNFHFQFMIPRNNFKTIDEKIEDLQLQNEEYQKNFDQNLVDLQTNFNLDLNNIRQDINNLDEKMDTILSYIKKQNQTNN